MGLEPLGSTWKKMKLESSYLILYKWINAINVKSKNAKLLGKKQTILMTLGKGKKQKA